MTVSQVNSTGANAATSTTGRGYSSLDQTDFLRLLTVQVQQQDPFDPVDNKEMLAQMAQFSSLAGINDVNSNLEQISAKLDALAAAQTAQSTGA
ncbi:flagellar biosynthesis protein FlgD [Croceibacterium sp. LX-88]|jgi:flagellar basal-body rod modification protein FlgD|uniref:Basal-body rod modification protein FlgD n=1 Tax=Croceibacterium selenioxidans TaxID=2838833 RepID=A0ABS5W0A9_9SPHN|nr:flagellar hook capping FlgD N-terminal domain-containing protein [Croceibacterium selenioxidans]MBT2133208.1 flagellar biosynthesis protein FlgD [Croceibacterium selenioxidans]